MVRRTLCPLALLFALAAPVEAQRDRPARFATGLEDRETSRPRRAERVDFNMEDADLVDLVRMMTSITGHRFIITGSVRDLSATIAASGPVTRDEGYRAFLAILHQNALTVVRRGRYHVITDTQKVARRPTAVIDDQRAPAPDERFVTWIHHVEHMPLSEASQLLDGLRSADGRIIPHAATQTLIIIDTGANIHRMRRILAAVDVAQSDQHVWVEPIHFASADDLVSTLSAIFGGEAPARTAPVRRRAGAATAAQPVQPTATDATVLRTHMVFEGEWEPPVDYSRTQGLVTDMLDTIAEYEAEAEAAAISPPPDPEHRPRPPAGAGVEAG